MVGPGWHGAPAQALHVAGQDREDLLAAFSLHQLTGEAGDGRHLGSLFQIWGSRCRIRVAR